MDGETRKQETMAAHDPNFLSRADSRRRRLRHFSAVFFLFFFAADADPSDARDHFLRKWRLRRWWGIIRRPGTCMLENVKFLFISAHSSNRLQTKGLEIPCFAHVSVPFGCSRMQALYANASCDIAVSHAHKRSFSLARF